MSEIMSKIIVIGSPGAGKSTFARKMRDITNIPLYYLDMLWHKPDQTNIPTEEFDTHLREILQTDRWIIDGNYQRTLETRLKECNTVFLLDFPLHPCPDADRDVLVNFFILYFLSSRFLNIKGKTQQWQL